jgi:hypothetical protein
MKLNQKNALKNFTWIALSAFVFGCAGAEESINEAADAENDAFLSVDGKADGLGPAEGSAEAKGVLAVVNTLTLDALDDDVALDSRAAASIANARVGADGVLLTADDHRITTLAELDEIPWVGSRAFSKLLTYAQDYGYIGYEHVYLIHGFEEGSEEAQIILSVANSLSFEELDIDVALDARAAQGIVNARAKNPIASLAKLDEAPYVGASAFEKLLEYGQNNALPTSYDPFDSSLNNVAKITQEEAIALFAPGEASTTLGEFEFYQRVRVCNELTGCGEWDYLSALRFDQIAYQIVYFSGGNTHPECHSFRDAIYNSNTDKTGNIGLAVKNGEIVVAMDSPLTGTQKCEGSVASSESTCSEFRSQVRAQISQSSLCSSGWSGTTVIGASNVLYPDIYRENQRAYNRDQIETLKLNFHVTRDFIRGFSSYESYRDADGNYNEIEYVIFGQIK